MASEVSPQRSDRPLLLARFTVGRRVHAVTARVSFARAARGAVWRGLLLCGSIILLVSGARVTMALEHAETVGRSSLDVWGTEHGLTSNSVQSVVQTRDGYLWLGTKSGLARFDGVRFRIFDKINTPQLASNDVTALLEDSRGRLWVGTDGGGLLCLDEGELKRFTVREGLPENYVGTLVEDERGDVWATSRGKLMRLEANRFVRVGPQHGLGEANVRRFLRDGRGRLWAGTNSSLFFYEGGRFVRSAGFDGRVLQLAPAVREDGLWMLTDDGVCLFKDGRYEVRVPKARLPPVPLLRMTEDAAGDLWISTLGAGLLRVAGGEVSILSTKNRLPNDYTSDITEDREGNLWVGTYGGGLVRLKNPKITAYTAAEGLSADFAFSLAEDRAGALWIGTHGGGVNRFKDGVFTAYTTADGLAGDIVRAVHEDSRGRIWVGTENKGLSYLQDGRWHNLGTKQGLSSDAVYAIYENARGQLWVGTDNGLNLVRDGAVTVFTAAQGLPGNRIRSIKEDRRGALWIGTHGGGLARMTNEGVEVFTIEHGLSDNFVRAITEDRDGTLWLANYGAGVTRFRDGRFTAYTTQHGLYDNTVYQVLEDDFGNLWMDSNRGIFYASKREMNEVAEGRRARVTSVPFDASDGMKSSECNGGNQPSSLKRRDGTLWFPTIKGVVSIDPARLNANQLKPNVVVEQVKVDDESVKADDLATYNLKRPWQAIVPPGRDRFEFHYTALSLYAPEKVRFKYRLEGLSDEWVDAGARRTAYFTNLPPGDYRFRVIAANNDGVWNEAGASVAFTLQPYFYQTRASRILLALCAVLLCGAAYFLRERHTKRREQQLVRLVEERTQQLTAANETLTRLSNLDGLTGIANRRHFDEFFDAEWRRAVRGRAPLTVVLIDVDYFKNFNDTYGHQQGDECLRWIAAAIEKVFNRPGDLVARYGGEEFVAIFYGTPTHHAADMAETLRERVAGLQIPHSASPAAGHVTISLGAATMNPALEDEQESLILAADRALYEAKDRGRNCVCSVVLENSLEHSSHGR